MGDCAIFDAILLDNIMDLHMLSLGTLVPEGPCCLVVCFTQQDIKFTEVWHIMRFFAGSLIWYHTHKQRHTTHTRVKRLTHPYKYILTPPVMCSQQLLVFHWIYNCWYQKFTSQISTLSLLFKHYSLVEVTYLFIRFNNTKSFPWDKKNTDKNSVNK